MEAVPSRRRSARVTMKVETSRIESAHEVTAVDAAARDATLTRIRAGSEMAARGIDENPAITPAVRLPQQEGESRANADI